MTNTVFNQAAELIDQAGQTAHQWIDTCRLGGERLGELTHQRWNQALKEASSQLDAETRKNARHAQQVVSRYYGKGLELSTQGADKMVDVVVELSKTAASRAANLAQTYTKA